MRIAYEVEDHGDTAIEVGKYTLKGEEGQVLDTGKYTVIWKQEEGQWKLHRDIFNSSVPAASLVRAAKDDTVWVCLNHVKADKREQFEKFVHEMAWPAAERLGASQQNKMMKRAAKKGR